jgi:hypothetical protein
MAIRAVAGTRDQATLGAATSHYRIQTTYSELSRGAFQQPAKKTDHPCHSREVGDVII